MSLSGSRESSVASTQTLVQFVATPPAPPPSPVKRIPQPPNGRGRSFIAYVRLRDRDDYALAKALIREILPQEIDIRLSWTRQAEETRKGLVAKIVEAYPSFEKYADAWPIMYYCTQYLGDLRRSLGPMYKKRRPAAPSSASDTPYTGSPSLTGVGSSGDRQSARIAQRQERVNESHMRRQCASNSRVSPDAPPVWTEQAQRVQQSSSATTPSATTPSATTAAAAAPGVQVTQRHIIVQHLPPGEQEVLRFLLSVDGTFTPLLDHFRLAGITSKARLLTMAQWTSAEKEAFLTKEIRMNGFERKMVSDGLVKLLAREKA